MSWSRIIIDHKHANMQTKADADIIRKELHVGARRVSDSCNKAVDLPCKNIREGCQI
jgi:hypothetical protein